MADFPQKKILADLSAKDFTGRISEFERLLRHAKHEGKSGGLLVSSAPGAGATELLKQVYDKLFLESSDIIPFYFSLDKQDKTARQTARRFVQQFLLQTIAFSRRDPKLLDIPRDIEELVELALPSDAYWIDRIIEGLNRESDERTFVRNALSSPLRAAESGAKVFVMVDDIHVSAHFLGVQTAAEIQDVFSRLDVPFILAGRRRFMSGLTPFERIELDSFPFQRAGEIVATHAALSGVKVNEQTRDLIAAQLGGNVKLISSFLRAAQVNNANLDCFQEVERLYADKIFGGGFGRFYDGLFREIAPHVEIGKSIVGLLYDAAELGNEKPAAEVWQKRLNLNDAEFSRILNLLNIHEIVRVSSNRIEVTTENQILIDYIKVRFRLESFGENRALVFGESLSEYLKRAPQTMAKIYRRKSAIGLRDLMTAFAGQSIPPAVIDYGKFAVEYKGAQDVEVLRDLRSTAETISLPRIVFAAHADDVYRSASPGLEKERSAIAFGFQEKRYSDDDEIVWIAAEIDSKLEASRELTDFWCERLESTALMCNFQNFKIWLIAPEGFSPDAMKVLRERNAFGSSRKQVGLIREFLKLDPEGAEEPVRHEYEIVVPMGDEAELIAAHAVEEIAKRHHFDSKSINQIKTALVEACINASEHSLSPDRKIHQKFNVDHERIVITVSNRGLRLADNSSGETEANEERRGWGLRLMKKLMDEVKIEHTDDGTSISMTKYLKPA